MKDRTITLRWGRGCRPITTSAEQLDDPRSASNIWRCPVCSTSVARPHRPGRARVYCSNACRQRAYRWRCERRQFLRGPTPPFRARTYAESHGLRADTDFVTSMLDPRGRRVTACGAFALAARDNRAIHGHTKFYAVEGDGPGVPATTTCSSCVRLLGVPIRSMSDVLEEIDALPRAG